LIQEKHPSIIIIGDQYEQNSAIPKLLENILKGKEKIIGYHRVLNASANKSVAESRETPYENAFMESIILRRKHIAPDH
jgi:hypothetical protein